jgi:pimeloyl-ACP methyl ester carboxylesterase
MLDRPVVILGGFLAPAALYREMAASLRALTRRPVHLVPTLGVDWLPSVVPSGWNIILGKLDGSVRHALGQTAAQGNRATLVCHSAGGLIARLYAGDQPVEGRTYDGLHLLDRIVTLGTPHYSECRRAHGGMLACFANTHLPGAYASPAVQYVSVAGRFLRGNCRGSLRERHACDFYRKLSGDGSGWGDGLVPEASALLEGSRHIVLEGISHHATYGRPWFGSSRAVERWANALNAVARPDPVPRASVVCTEGTA